MALSVPILASVYTPEEFGVFGVYLSVIGLIALIASGKLESALMLTSRRFERALILKCCLLIVSIFTFLVFVFLFLFNELVKKYLGANSFIPVLLIIPGVFTLCFHNFMTINANSNREYIQVSKGTLYRTVAIVLLQLLLGYLSLGADGLIIGSILSYVFCMAYFFYTTGFTKDYTAKKVTIIKSRYILKRYERTYLYLLPQSLLNYVSQQLPFLIFPFFYTSSVIGGLFMAQRLLKLPAGVLTMALRNVFFPLFRDKNQGEIFIPYVKLTVGLFILGLPISIVLYYQIPSLVVFVLGSEWYDAGQYSRYLIMWVFMSVVNVATTPALTIISENKLLLNYEISDFMVKVVLLVYCTTAAVSAINTIFYYSIVCSISYVIICFVCAFRLYLIKNNQAAL